MRYIGEVFLACVCYGRGKVNRPWGTAGLEWIRANCSSSVQNNNYIVAEFLPTELRSKFSADICLGQILS